MTKFISLAALVSVALLSSDWASAETKARKPTVCVDFREAKGADGKVAIAACYDGKRPRVFTVYTRVTFVDQDGKPASYVLGF